MRWSEELVLKCPNRVSIDETCGHKVRTTACFVSDPGTFLDPPEYEVVFAYAPSDLLAGDVCPNCLSVFDSNLDALIDQAWDLCTEPHPPDPENI